MLLLETDDEHGSEVNYRNINLIKSLERQAECWKKKQQKQMHKPKNALKYSSNQEKFNIIILSWNSYKASLISWNKPNFLTQLTMEP